MTASHFPRNITWFLRKAFQVKVMKSVGSIIRLCGLNPNEQRKDSSNSRKTGLPPATPRQKFGSGLLDNSQGAPSPHAAKSRRYALSGESSRRGAESPKPTVKSKPVWGVMNSSDKLPIRERPCDLQTGSIPGSSFLQFRFAIIMHSQLGC